MDGNQCSKKLIQLEIIIWPSKIGQGSCDMIHVNFMSDSSPDQPGDYDLGGQQHCKKDP